MARTKWLLLATHGDDLSALGRADIEAFDSSTPDGQEGAPTRGDLERAALALAERSEIPVEKIGRLKLALVPLDGARQVELDVGVRAELVSSGGPA